MTGAAELKARRAAGKGEQWPFAIKFNGPDAIDMSLVPFRGTRLVRVFCSLDRRDRKTGWSGRHFFGTGVGFVGSACGARDTGIADSQPRAAMRVGQQSGRKTQADPNRSVPALLGAKNLDQAGKDRRARF